VLKYSLRKILAMIPKMFVITIIMFVILEALPGDPLARSIDPNAYGEMTEYEREQARERLGLNRPAPVRYFEWLGNILQGDLGYSTTTKQPINQMVAQRLPASMELNFYALIISAVIGVFFGFLCAVFQRTPIDYTLSGISAFGISLPEYFFALAFMIIFSVKLDWFPAGGRVPTDTLDPTFWERLPYMILPIGTLVFTMVCGLVRHTRTTTVDVMNKDYIKTARAKGLSETVVNLKHGLRNALPPVMTMLVMRLPRLMGGAIVIEQVFNYIGIGTMSMTASKAGDAPVCLFTCVISAIMTLVASTLVDIVTAALDPRVRFE